MAARPSLPILPIRNRVLFPLCTLQVNIGRPKSITLMEDRVLDGDHGFKKNIMIGVFTLRNNDDSNNKTGAWPDLYEVGTLARVTYLHAPNLSSDGNVANNNSTSRSRGRSAGNTVNKGGYKYILVVEGIRRIRLQRITSSSPYVLAEIDALPLVKLPSAPTKWSSTAIHQLKSRYAQVISHLGAVDHDFVKRSQALLSNVHRGNVLELVDIIASIVKGSVEEKMQVLSCLDPQQRMLLVNKMLQRQLDFFKVADNVQESVKNNLDKNRQKFYLREQLKVIKKQLGEDDEGRDGNEIDELASKIAALNLPDAVEKIVNKDIQRLRRMQPAQPEFSVILNYLEFILTLPWHDTPTKPKHEAPAASELAGTDLPAKAAMPDQDENPSSNTDPQLSDGSSQEKAASSNTPHDADTPPTGEEIDLQRASRILDEDHYGLDVVKKRVLQYLAVCKLRQDTSGSILCLVGPPGVGKTSLGHSVASAMRRKFHRLCLGGVRDEAEIRGHRRTYIGALPGQVLQAFAQTGSTRPVILLDEIDKLGQDARGNPSAALLEVLDPAQNKTFKDHYLAAPFDISKALFIATANDLSTIPRPLLDRMEVIVLPSYSLDEKVQIARAHLIPKMERVHGLPPNSVQTSDDCLHTIVREYTQEAGVRTLERTIAAVCRHVALDRASEDGSRGSQSSEMAVTHVTRAMLPEILGPCKFAPPTTLFYGSGSSEDFLPVAGVSLGLAWTPFGGEVLTIETAKMAGRGRVVLTGRLGETMQESAQIALAWIRSHSSLLGLNGTTKEASLIEGTDVHIHFPAGAIPKDGPSAGVAMTAALVSLFLNRPLPSDIAMTGEISLSGAVLPVGGIKEKVVAAHAAGCRGVIVPHRNAGDLLNVPNDSKEQLDVLTAERIEDVLELLFGPLPLRPLSNSRVLVDPLTNDHPDVLGGSDRDNKGNAWLVPVFCQSTQSNVCGEDTTCIPLRSSL